MEQFKISTLSEQFPNQLAQGKEGKVRSSLADSEHPRTSESCVNVAPCPDV